MEATGNYWVALAVTLHEAGYRVAVVNPRQAHHCAKAQLRRAKTDALDARDLAQLAAALQPAPWTPPPAVYHEVRQRLVARDGLLAMRTQARNQRHALLQWPVVVAAVRQHLDELIAGCPLGASTGGSPRWRPRSPRCSSEGVWAEALACLTSAPGIGLVTASWLLVGTLNFALCAGPESLTAYAGLAPVPRESGRSVRGRPTIGHDGNSRLRTALYMATLSAARYNPAIKAFYQRLRAAGSRRRWRAAPPRASCSTRPGRSAASCSASTRAIDSTTPCPISPLDDAARGGARAAGCHTEMAAPREFNPGVACGVATPQATPGSRPCRSTGATDPDERTAQGLDNQYRIYPRHPAIIPGTRTSKLLVVLAG